MSEPTRADSSPQEPAAPQDPWFAEHRARMARAHADLHRDQGEEAEKLNDGHGARLSHRQPDGTLLRDVTETLVSAGFTLHDCAARASTGGVCLTPLAAGRSVIATWTTHDALASSAHRYVENRRVHGLMNQALADVLEVMGWPVTPHGSAGAHCVTGPPSDAPEAPTLFDPADER